MTETNKDVREGDQSGVIGAADHPMHRAPAGEGVRAPLAQEGADHPEFSIFDGKGNESVVVVTTDDDGRPVEATGPSSAEATKAAKKPGNPLGADFGPPGH